MTEDQSSGQHTAKEHNTKISYRLSALCILIALLLIWAAASAWMIADTYFAIDNLRDSKTSYLIESASLATEAASHRTAAAAHRTAILMESVKESEPKDVSVKRLALSIAMAKNGTGFEDRLMERIRQNASDEELNSIRISFLTSLFENYPPAIKSQEGIQMQMDAVIIELRAAGGALDQYDFKLKEAAELSAQIQDRQEYARNLWRSIIISIISILIALSLGAYLLKN